MFAIIPVTNTALGTLPIERVKNASGLFNLMRNLGGAIGLAAINTWFNDRMDLHLTRLHEAVNTASIPATEMLANLTARFQGSDAQLQALKQMMAIVRLQAAVMSYADVFLLMTFIFLALAACGLLMKRPAAPAEAAAGH
jgi:MFS transporter, DHA2 family, multidrug resistance protein